MLKYLFILSVLLLQVLFTPQNAFYPAQYIAKLYTEGLGRAPDQLGYFGYANYFQLKGCSAFTLQVVGFQILSSAESKNLNLSSEQRVLSLFRAALNREPDGNELATYTNLLSNKGLDNVIQTLLKSKEFTGKVPQLCKSKDYERLARYGWNGKPLKLSNSPTGYNGNSEAEFRRELSLYPFGTTFTLAENAYIELSSPLILDGVTLQTFNNPSHYTKMARFVRAKNFKGSAACGQPECGEPLIVLRNNAKLVNVWVDGNGNNLPYRVWDINVQSAGSNNQILNSRIENTAGFSNLQTFGALEGLPCQNVLVKGNIILGYNSDGFPNNNSSAPWVDGITCSCENTIIEENSIIDTSDVAIVVFNAPRGVTQNTKVRFNNIFQAGNSNFAGLNTDHIFINYAADFSGTVFENNLLWTSDYASMRSGISVGSNVWGQAAGGSGFGVKVLNNTTGFGFILGQYAISVAGIDNATIKNNNPFNYKPRRRCDNIPVTKYISTNSSDTDITFTDYNQGTLTCR